VPFDQAFTDAMVSHHREAIDTGFAEMMIPHHEGAIAIANAAEHHG
jgi:uncharacterized protein (DUF305 family)